jgi:hypothetical protein
MRRALVPVALLVLLVLLSCQQKPAGLVPQSVVADARTAFVILGDLPLWTLAQGTLTLKENIPIGEKLSLQGQAAKAVQAGKERDFVQVRRESGGEGWVRADYVVSRAILAVVTTEGAVIYSVPNNTAATTAGIPRMTIVTIHVDTGGMTFIRVTGYDPAARVLLKGVYLRNEGVSSRPADVQAAILLQLAAASKNRKQQQAFLTSAIKDNPDSIFMPELNAALAALTGTAPPAPAATEPAAGFLSASEDTVNVYDAPDEKSGKLLGSLTKGQKVDVQEKTVDSMSIGGRSAPWYRIKDPAGWVFGASLAPAP